VVTDTPSSCTCWFGDAIYESHTAVWQIMHLQQQLLALISSMKASGSEPNKLPKVTGD